MKMKNVQESCERAQQHSDDVDGIADYVGAVYCVNHSSHCPMLMIGSLLSTELML